MDPRFAYLAENCERADGPHGSWGALLPQLRSVVCLHVALSEEEGSGTRAWIVPSFSFRALDRGSSAAPRCGLVLVAVQL
jgi:hypothetical protein